MLFWVIAALLTLGASLAVLLPLSRRGPTHAIEGSHDLEVYRDQLAELDRDAERGLIQPAEAEQARAEIARRILKADKAAAVATGTAVSRSGRAIGVAAVLAVPAGELGHLRGDRFARPAVAAAGRPAREKSGRQLG